MSVEALYLLRKAEPSEFHELDVVELLTDLRTDDGDTVRAGARGTIVGAWSGGRYVEVEFPEPEGALATVAVTDLRRVVRSPA